MIYFIQEVGLLRSRVKIGFTDDLKNRLGGIRGDSPSPVKVLLVLPGDRKIEAIYHEYFAGYRLHREWFRFGRKLRLFIRANRHLAFVPPEIKEAKETTIFDLNVEPEPEPEPEPDEKQTAILEFFDSGETIVSKIARAALGSKGGPQSKKVRETVLEFRGVKL